MTCNHAPEAATARNFKGGAMTLRLMVALACALLLFSFMGAAKATSTLEARLAVLEKENVALKNENTELRKRLNVAARSEPKVVEASLAQAPKGQEEKSPDELVHNWNGWYAGGNAG